MSDRARAEIKERLTAAAPKGWYVTDPTIVTTEGPGDAPETVRWQVNCALFLALEDASGQPSGIRSMSVDVIGSTLEDLLTVVRRLDRVEAALTFPPPIDVQIEAATTGDRQP